MYADKVSHKTYINQYYVEQHYIRADWSAEMDKNDHYYRYNGQPL